MEFKELILEICEVLYNKKAQDIVALHVADKTIVADWFVICSGRNTQQVKALCDDLEEKAETIGITLKRKDGYQQGRWIVLDYSSILIHLFIPEERQYYNMERLWADDESHAIYYSQMKDGDQ